MSELTYLIAIPALFVAVSIWFIRERSNTSIVGLLGAVFIFSGHVCHFIFPSVKMIALGGLQPMIDQNQVVAFFYIHGLNCGLFLLSLAIGFRFFPKKNV